MTVTATGGGDATPAELSTICAVALVVSVPVRRPDDESERPGTGADNAYVTGVATGNTLATT